MSASRVLSRTTYTVLKSDVAAGLDISHLVVVAEFDLCYLCRRILRP